MKVLVTGSSGRIGRAIFAALAGQHEVVGLDLTPFATTHVIGDVAEKAVIERALEGTDAVIHTAALHAPHVGIRSEADFLRINVDATVQLYVAACRAGVRSFVFTSTTALYGHAVQPGRCTWIDESTQPEPRTIYHSSKVAAETALEGMASNALPVSAIRMSRCFPETADLMAAYRLHRGVDVRDVADAHVAALERSGSAFEVYNVSGATPFKREDCERLAVDFAGLVKERAPGLARAFSERGWQLPQGIDRVYHAGKAHRELGWSARHGWEEVPAQLDRQSLECLPVGSGPELRSE